METRTNGAIAGIRGSREGQFEMALVKPWAPARPAVLSSLPVITAPVAGVLGGELCPSPDQKVTQSHQLRSAARPAAMSFGASAVAFRQNATSGIPAGYDQAVDVLTSTGSLRQAPPG